MYKISELNKQVNFVQASEVKLASECNINCQCSLYFYFNKHKSEHRKLVNFSNVKLAASVHEAYKDVKYYRSDKIFVSCS